MRVWWLIDVSEHYSFLAVIFDDKPVRDSNQSILAEGFYVRKPSTLILKNVDDRFNGRYTFEARDGFKQRSKSVVTVFVASKCYNYSFHEFFTTDDYSNTTS